MSLEERVKYAQMKARHAQKIKPWYKKWWGATLIIITGILMIFIVASVFYVINQINIIRQEKSQESIVTEREAYQAAITGGGNFSIGTSNPQVTIIEFADFSCPYCEQSSSIVRKIAEQNKDKVKFVYRDYPLHDNSILLALAARCAGEQAKFWEFHDLLFTNQEKLNETGADINTGLLIIAESLKINLDQFSNCLETKKYYSQIKRDFDDAEKLQIEGTPTWFINNYPLTGYIPEEKFLDLINGLLN